VVAVIDRVDSAGTKTPSLEETVVGVVSGSNLVTATRGAEGTAQAHLAGAVVEILITNVGWNDLIDGLLVAHNQDGTHKSGSVLTLPQINDTSSDHQYILSVCELAADRTVALPLLTGNDEFVFKDHTQTFTNKRISKRVVVTTQSATPTINTDSGDIFQITGLAQAITSMTTNLTGTPVAGDMIEVQITDNGTARAITWGASFSATTVALPATTTVSTMLRVLFQRNNANTVWDCIGSI